MSQMTEAEFHEFCNHSSFRYAPDGYWTEVNERRKKHRFVGKTALINHQIWECVRAEDDLVILRPQSGEATECIISGDLVEKIVWMK